MCRQLRTQILSQTSFSPVLFFLSNLSEFVCLHFNFSKHKAIVFADKHACECASLDSIAILRRLNI